MSEATLGSRRVYTGRVINLDVDRVRFPDGSEGELEMIRHPGASAVVPFLSDPHGDDPQVMLIRQYRYAADSFVYEIPAGRRDEGESPIMCARRELLEETGCTAGRVEPLITIHTTPGFTDEQINLFMAWELTRGGVNRDRDEFMEVESYRLSKVLEMIDGGQITDGKTIVGLLYTAGFRLGR